MQTQWIDSDSLGGAIGQFLLAKLDVLFDAVAEATATSCDVAGDAVLAALKGEAFQTIVLDLATHYLNQVSLD